MPDTYVALRSTIDLGDGPSDEHRFDNAKHIVDKESGWLHIHDQHGTVASFPPGTVIVACRTDAAVVSGVRNDG